MHTHKTSAPFLILALGIILMLACGAIPEIVPMPTNTPAATNTPTATDTPEPTPTPISYDGEWHGATSQGLEIAFTVENDEIASTALRAEVQGAGCSVSIETTGNFTNPYPIKNGTFEIASSGGGTSHTFTGTFDSPNSASGTLEYTVTIGCNGTVKVDWTAEKSAP